MPLDSRKTLARLTEPAPLLCFAQGVTHCKRAVRCLEEVYPLYHTETALMLRSLARLEWQRLAGSSGGVDVPISAAAVEAAAADVAAGGVGAVRAAAARAAAKVALRRALEIVEVCYGRQHVGYDELAAELAECTA
jgi:hypothetical protein